MLFKKIDRKSRCDLFYIPSNTLSFEDVAMKNTYGLDAKKYQTILTNHLDRLVDFYTTLYAVKTEIQDLKDYLSSTMKFLISDLIDKGLSLNDIKKYNIEEEALDIFQVNFSYNRKIQNTILANGDQEEKDKYKQISAIIYELATGHSVCTHSDGRAGAHFVELLTKE